MVYRIVFFFELFWREWDIGCQSGKPLLAVVRHSPCSPVNISFLNVSKIERLQILNMREQILRHPIDFFRISGHLFVEDACPDERVQLVLGLVDGGTVDEEVEIE